MLWFDVTARSPCACACLLFVAESTLQKANDLIVVGFRQNQTRNGLQCYSFQLGTQLVQFVDRNKTVVVNRRLETIPERVPLESLSNFLSFSFVSFAREVLAELGATGCESDD